MTPNPAPPGGLPPKVPILTIYGLYVRQMGGWLAISDLVQLMATLGYAEQVTRSAASRMKKGGLLSPRTAGRVSGYELTGAALEILADGDARIFHARTPADPADGWVLITFSVPEHRRSDRHVLRSRLVWLGFGQVAGGVWLAPCRAMAGARQMLDRTGLAAYASLWQARYLGDAAEMVRDAWDLEELERSYQRFLDIGRPAAAKWQTEHPGREAFTDYTQIVSVWRRLPYLDPGLPASLLPSPWTGAEARSLFGSLDGRLRERATRYVADLARRRNPIDETSEER